MGLCTDQRADQVVEAFRGLTRAEARTVTDKAMDRLEREADSKKKGEFGQLFDNQLKTLKDRGCPEVVTNALAAQRSEVISRAQELGFAEGNAPFLPVIPERYVSLYSQMEMVRNDGKKGICYLDISRLTDEVETPRNPYYIFDVEDGEVMRGKASKDAKTAINRQKNRRGLVAIEVVALGIHTDVLSRHYVDAVGSRCDSGFVPALYPVGGQPRLYWSYAGFGISVWGAASCRSV